MAVDCNSPLSWRYRMSLAALACFQNSLVGGLVYGWASITAMLTAPAVEGGAALTLAETTRIFSWASCVGMLATLVLGWVLDRFGPRACSVVSHACVAVGCQLFAFSTRFEMFAASTCLIAFGGPGVQVSIVHLANLFPENQFLTLSLLNGTISISFAVLAGAGYLWDTLSDFNFRALFGYLSLLVVVSLIASVLYWPDTPFEAPEKRSTNSMHTAEDEYIEASTAHQRLLEQPLNSYLRTDYKHSESFRISEKAIASGNETLVSLKDQPFRNQVFSGTYFRALLFFCTSCFVANFYVASISTELADFQDFPMNEQYELARIFTLVMAGGVIASFLVGWLMDKIGLEICMALTLLLGMVHMVVLSLYSDERVWMIFGFFAYVFFRQFMFPVYIASLTSRLGYKYFGLLNGMGFAASGLAQAFMASLIKATAGTCHMMDDITDCDHGRWPQLHGVEFVLLGALLLVPFFDHREKIRLEKRIEEKRRVTSSWRNLTVGNYGSLPIHQETGLSDGTETSVGMEL